MPSPRARRARAKKPKLTRMTMPKFVRILESIPLESFTKQTARDSSRPARRR